MFSIPVEHDVSFLVGHLMHLGLYNETKNARILGNIKTKALGIESGAEIQGNVMVVK